MFSPIPLKLNDIFRWEQEKLERCVLGSIRIFQVVFKSHQIHRGQLFWCLSDISPWYQMLRGFCLNYAVLAFMIGSDKWTSCLTLEQFRHAAITAILISFVLRFVAELNEYTSIIDSPLSLNGHPTSTGTRKHNCDILLLCSYGLDFIVFRQVQTSSS